MRKKNFDDSYHSTSGGMSDGADQEQPAVQSSGDGDIVQSRYGADSGSGAEDSSAPSLFGIKKNRRDSEVASFIARVRREDLNENTAAIILAKYPEVYPNRLAEVMNALEEHNLVNDAEECYLNAAESLTINPNIEGDDLAKFVMVLPGNYAYAANCLNINPDIVPSRLVNLSAALAKYTDLPDMASAEILKINPQINPTKLVMLIDATIRYSANGSANTYYKGATAVLRANPNLDISKFFQMMNVTDTQFSNAESKALKIDIAAILNVDPNVNPDHMVRMIRAWSESFKSLLQDAGLDQKTQKTLIDKFNESVAIDAVKALKDKPNAQPEQIIQMMAQFNQFGLSADTAATIVNDNSNINMDSMLNVMHAFQHTGLDCVTAAKMVEVNPQVNIDKLSALMGAFQGAGLDYVNAAKY